MSKVLSGLTLKRITGDINLLQSAPLEFIDAKPDENDMLTWHFLLRGPDDSLYKDGWYIGQILFPESYPLAPPDFKMLTPSGRFTINSKICMTNSGYHASEWSAMWTIQAILLGFLSIMLSDARNDQGISAIKETDEQRKVHAQKSIEYNVKHYNKIFTGFDRMVNPDGTVKTNEEIKEIVKNMEASAIEAKKKSKGSKSKNKVSDQNTVSTTNVTTATNADTNITTTTSQIAELANEPDEIVVKSKKAISKNKKNAIA